MSRMGPRDDGTQYVRKKRHKNPRRAYTSVYIPVEDETCYLSKNAYESKVDDELEGICSQLGHTSSKLTTLLIEQVESVDHQKKSVWPTLNCWSRKPVE